MSANAPLTTGREKVSGPDIQSIKTRENATFFMAENFIIKKSVS
jgi:hypothetical protein